MATSIIIAFVKVKENKKRREGDKASEMNSVNSWRRIVGSLQAAAATAKVEGDGPKENAACIDHDSCFPLYITYNPLL